MPDDIEIIFGKEIHGFTRSTEGWTITLSDKTKIKTEILILTCSDGLKKIKQTSVFNLQYTQGQVTHLDKNKFSAFT